MDNPATQSTLGTKYRTERNKTKTSLTEDVCLLRTFHASPLRQQVTNMN